MEEMSLGELLQGPTAGSAVAGDEQTPDATARPGPRRPSVPAALEERFPYLLDLRSGVILFVIFAGFAVSPLGRHVDRLTYVRPVRPGMEVFPLLRDGLDHIASQGGEGVIMAGLAGALTLVMRTSLPLLIGAATEGLFYLTGLVKLLFAKDAPRFGTPDYWAGGYLSHGKFGMAFPSGHTSEVVLVFGAIVLLLHVGFPRWAAARSRAIKLVWVVVAVNAAAVSWAIGTHWLTDLVGGLIFGGLALRVLVLLVAKGYLPGIASWIDAWTASRLTTAWSHVRGVRPAADPAAAGRSGPRPPR
jgi:hypothetical protein